MRRGNCYVTSEAVYHLLGGKSAGWKPMTVRHEGDVHWFLARLKDPYQANAFPFPRGWEILDLTKSQFLTPVPYHKAVGRGFLTKHPSERAKALIQTLVWQEVA